MLDVDKKELIKNITDQVMQWIYEAHPNVKEADEKAAREKLADWERWATK